MESMEFIETPTFTRLVTVLLTDEAYRGLQNLLIDNPDCGDLIPGSGGLRKVRYGQDGRGKRGGLRVIYYWAKEKHLIYFLLIYPKSKKDDLTAHEVALLRTLVKEL